MSHKIRYFLDSVIIGTVSMFLTLLFIVFIIRPTVVVGESMLPTLTPRQPVSALPLTTYGEEVKTGDIVLVDTPEGFFSIIKRVIAVPGDTLEIKDNNVILNGKILQEDYLGEPMLTYDIPQFTLGDEEYFVLGDNRNNSADSRYFGVFEEGDILGVVVSQKLIHFIFAAATVLLFIIIVVITTMKIVDKYCFVAHYKGDDENASEGAEAESNEPGESNEINENSEE